MEVDILILGPVELRVDGRREAYGAAKRAQFLAALAIEAGRPVELDVLARRLSDDAPPGKPHASLHAYAARVRRRIGAGLLTQQAHAYTLAVGPDAVDYHRFDRLAKQARSLVASGDDTQALTLLREAEALRRGTPLAGVGGLWAEQVRRPFDERLLAVQLQRYAIELRMGRFEAIVDELAALVERWPVDETVAHYYMAAAYGRGQTMAAMRTYEALRRRLRAVGTEPGPALARTHARILDRAPVGELFADRPPSMRGSTPNWLPAHPDLVGREAELQALVAPGSGTVSLHAISGMAGVGKSLLALHVARKLARHYPAGSLYVNLRAHGGPEPLPARAALTTLLRQLGIPAAGLPPDLDDLSAVWRNVLSSLRAAIVLDDAVGPDQLRPLLPGDSPSLVLVTSRRRLTALPGARHVFLNVLPQADAAALFTARVGAERAGERAELAELVRLAGYLPLALDLLAGRLRSRPTWTVSYLVRRLSDGSARLAEIRDGAGAEVASAFALSYDQLTTEQQRVFRLLLHFAPAFGPHATAALTGLPLAATERVIEQLYDVYLLGEPTPERFEAADLLRLYAHMLTLAHDPEPVREAARDRLADFYLHAATRADRLLFPRSDRLERPLPSGCSRCPGGPTPSRRGRGRSRRRPGSPRRRTATATGGGPSGPPNSPKPSPTSSTPRGSGRRRRSFTRTPRATGTRRATRRRGSRPPRTDRGPVPPRPLRGGRAQRAPRARGGALRPHDPAAEAEALRVLGLMAWDLGRLDESLQLQRAALELRSRTEIPGTSRDPGTTSAFPCSTSAITIGPRRISGPRSPHSSPSGTRAGRARL